MHENLNPKAWFSNIPKDLLAGAVVALALVPEAIAFSIIAGVDPKVGLYASFCIAITTSFLGGRPGMISAATGAMALLMVTLVKDYGLQYLLATTILTGILQIIWGKVKLGNQMRFVPRAVMVGFVNALAILIFDAQLPQFEGEGASLLVYLLVGVGLGIIYGLPIIMNTLKAPNFLKAIPSPLIAIILVTTITRYTGWEIPTVGDMGELPDAFPVLALPQVPFNLETFKIILPYALSLSFVGLLESFLTANVIDDLTNTPSNKNQEAIGQGISNIIAGFFGGMAGCAMIGQSVINVTSGGRTRLSTLSAGVFLFIGIIIVGDQIAQVPMAVLVSVMFMVSFSTFSWGSLKNIRRIPKSETAVMVTTVFITILTHNLAMGVIIGVALSTIFFSRKIADLTRIESELHENGTHRTYHVYGQVFFVSVENFLSGFDFTEKLETVHLDLTHAHLWDQSSVDVIDKIVFRFRKNGIKVDLIGMNEASATLIDRLALHRNIEMDDLPLH
jgi:SulP family sulfate permease